MCKIGSVAIKGGNGAKAEDKSSSNLLPTTYRISLNSYTYTSSDFLQTQIFYTNKEFAPNLINSKPRADRKSCSGRVE
jgi:hypothetical protein